MIRTSARALLVPVAVGVLGITMSIGAMPAAAGQRLGDWYTFRGNAEHTAVSHDSTVSATTAPTFVQDWASLSGGGKSGHASIPSSPAAIYDGFLHEWLVYDATGGTPTKVDAFDAATGELVWAYTIDNGSTVSSPSVFDNTVYVGDHDHNLYAINATTGNLECSYTTTGEIDASPVVGDVDGTGPVVYFGDFGTLQTKYAGNEWAVNGVGNSAGACTLKWKFNDWANTSTNPQATGSWSSPALGTDADGTPVLVFGSSNPDDSVYALNAVTGAELWHFRTTVLNDDDDVGAPPTISAPGVNGFADGVVYVDGKDEIEYALNLTTGAEIWSFNMGADTGVSGPVSVSGNCLVGNRVLVSYDQYTYALDATTGKKLWRSPATAATELASPAVSGPLGNEVVFEGDVSGNEYAYSVKTGALLKSWSTGSNSSIWSSAAIADGQVFFGTRNGEGRLVALGPPAG